MLLTLVQTITVYTNVKLLHVSGLSLNDIVGQIKHDNIIDIRLTHAFLPALLHLISESRRTRLHFSSE